MTSTPIPSATRLALIFKMILAGLEAAMDTHSVRLRVREALIALIWKRLYRLAKRFEAIAIRAEAGTLRPVRPRPTPPETPDPEAPPEEAPREPRPKNPLPQGFGWLVRMVPEAAAFAIQLEFLLAQPEMKALLAAAP